MFLVSEPGSVCSSGTMGSSVDIVGISVIRCIEDVLVKYFVCSLCKVSLMDNIIVHR